MHSCTASMSHDGDDGDIILSIPAIDAQHARDAMLSMLAMHEEELLSRTMHLQHCVGRWHHGMRSMRWCLETIRGALHSNHGHHPTRGHTARWFACVLRHLVHQVPCIHLGKDVAVVETSLQAHDTCSDAAIPAYLFQCSDAAIPAYLFQQSQAWACISCTASRG